MDIKIVCQILGPIWDLDRECGTNAYYQQELAKRIQATGKTTKELTIGELLELCRDTTQSLGEIQA